MIDWKYFKEEKNPEATKTTAAIKSLDSRQRNTGSSDVRRTFGSMLAEDDVLRYSKFRGFEGVA